MKSKLKHILMLQIGLLVSCGMFSACEDDTDVMGAVAINSCQYTATTVTPIWTLVPNSNCDGYIVSLYLGTRSNVGTLVEQKKFDNRTCSCTFENLTPSTNYVLSTQAIPSASSDFDSAEVYWKEFTTAAE